MIAPTGDRVDRVESVDGVIRWNPVRSAWFLAMALPTLAWPFIATPSTPTGEIALSSAALTLLTVCVGHSVGLHRGVVHRAYRTSRALRAVLCVLAALAGIGPPLTLLRVHAIRDHWQNARRCPRFYRYQHGLVRDFWWNLHCQHVPPAHAPDPDLRDDDKRDTVLVFLERHWRALQLVVAIPAYAWAGVAGVVGLVCARVTIAIVMHWLVGYFAHKDGSFGGYQSFDVDALEQGRNSIVFGAVSFGEGWHNNHHACPDSARFGFEWWEVDAGFLVIRALEACGLVWDVNAVRALRSGASERSATPARAATARATATATAMTTATATTTTTTTT